MTREVRKPQPLKTIATTPDKLNLIDNIMNDQASTIREKTSTRIAESSATFEESKNSEVASLASFTEQKNAEVAASREGMDAIAAEIAKLQKQLLEESKKHFETKRKADVEVKVASANTATKIKEAEKLKDTFNKSARAIEKSELKAARKEALLEKIDAIGEIFNEMIARGVYITDAIAESITKLANGIKNVVDNISENYKKGHDAPTNRKVPKTLQPK